MKYKIHLTLFSSKAGDVRSRVHLAAIGNVQQQVVDAARAVLAAGTQYRAGHHYID